MKKLPLEVRAVLQEIKVAEQLGHQISLAQLNAFYGKENVDHARTLPQWNSSVVAR